MEVNEQIIEQYLKLIKNWFYITDISFKVPHNYSNIDLLAYNPKEDKYYDFEVKFRSAYTVSLKNLEIDIDFNNYINQITKNERHFKIKSIIGEKEIIKIFVTTQKLFGKSTLKRNQVEQLFKKRINELGFECEVWYFENIILELYNHTEKNGRYNTELMQTIRLIKTYLHPNDSCI